MEPNYSVIFSARLVAATTVTKGDVLIPSASPDQYVVATAANRGTRGSEGVALTAYGGSGTGSVDLQQSGIVDASISGLGTAVGRQLVRVSTTGRMERVGSYTPGDDIIGYAEESGRVHLMFGIPWSLIGGGGGGLTLPILLDTDNATDHIKYGPNPSGGSYPSFGALRSERQADGTDRHLVAIKDSSGNDIPFLSHDWVRLAIGAGWDQSDLNAGVTTRMAKIGMWADTTEVYSDRLSFTDDRGAYVRHFDATRTKLTTANATPTALGLAAPDVHFSGVPYAIFLQAYSAGAKAEWIWSSVNGLVYSRKDAGLSAANFDGTNVTGISGSVEWRATGIGPIYAPTAGASTNGSNLDILRSNGSGGFATALTPGSNVATLLATFSSANLLAALTTKTGTGLIVFDTSPTIGTPTINNPTFGGNLTLGGASNVTTNDTKGKCYDVNPVNVQTSSNTPALLDSFTLASNTAVLVSWLVLGFRDTFAEACAYTVTAVFRNNAGTVTRVATPVVSVIAEDDATCDATADNSTTTVRLMVTGPSAKTYRWTSVLTRLEVIP